LGSGLQGEKNVWEVNSRPSGGKNLPGTAGVGEGVLRKRSRGGADTNAWVRTPLQGNFMSKQLRPRGWGGKKESFSRGKSLKRSHNTSGATVKRKKLPFGKKRGAQGDGNDHCEIEMKPEPPKEVLPTFQKATG